jgi:hypothetical protein
MIFESKRLLELAGLPVEGESSLLKESKEDDKVEEFSSDDGVTEGDAADEKEECDEADGSDEEKIREAVRSQLEHMWASGEVFGRKAANRGGVTQGFPGVGFKK